MRISKNIIDRDFQSIIIMKRKEMYVLRILLIDGLSLLYRAYYSSRIEYNSHKEPINALKKYLITIHNICEEYPCDEIIICEDAPRDTLYRQKMFVEYKQGRKRPPEEFLQQKNILFGFLRKIGFPVIGISGYEADDIIGTMSKSLSEEGHSVLIASPDKDMYQLLTNDRIAMIRHNPMTHSQQLLYRDDIYRDNGYWPEQVVELKILAGDSSDNIPGVPRCGYRNAVKILQKHGTISSMMISNDEDPIVIKAKEYISSHSDTIDMFHKIITIQTDIDQDTISKQLAYRVSKDTFNETMNRYQVMHPDDFMTMNFSEYLFNRLTDQKGENE